METPDSGPVAGMLEHLTGKSRGSFSWITDATSETWLDRGGCLRAGPSAPAGARVLARLHRVGRSFDIEAAPGEQLWINRKPVEHATLRHGDMVEFGEDGPLSRFRVYDDRHRPPMGLGGVLTDAAAYLRSSRRPLPRRLGRALWSVPRRIATDMTLLFRTGVLLALVVLTVALALQYRADRRLREEIASGTAQVAALSDALADARREAIRPGDLAALEAELEQRLSSAADRLAQLETRSRAVTRVIAEASPSVVFLQGAYGLRHRESGQMLRHVLGPDGLPVMLPNGQPYLALEGTGPVAEAQFNGTGFLLKGSGLVVTNRHVAVPWGDGPSESDAMEPVMVRFIGYLPDSPAPGEVTLAAVSDRVDLALLRLSPVPGDRAGLVLAEAPPQPGDGVILIGYPTGLRSLLAQTGKAFLESLREDGATGFWEVAARLAEAGLIKPLASRGIVAQATETTVIYDAETTHGGSGGPVLNLRGEVMAVNTAILPEFGGANLGVPAAEIRALLAEVNTAN